MADGPIKELPTSQGVVEAAFPNKRLSTSAIAGLKDVLSGADVGVVELGNKIIALTAKEDTATGKKLIEELDELEELVPSAVPSPPAGPSPKGKQRSRARMSTAAMPDMWPSQPAINEDLGTNAGNDASEASDSRVNTAGALADGLATSMGAQGDGSQIEKISTETAMKEAEEVSRPELPPISGRQAKAAKAKAKALAPPLHWNDEKYQQFYAASAEEQRALKDKVGGAGLTEPALERLELSYQRHGVGVPPTSPQVRRESKTAKPGRLAHFQVVFATRSRGNSWILVGQAHALLMDMGLSVTRRRVAELAEEWLMAYSAEKEPVELDLCKLPYAGAVWLYTEVLQRGQSAATAEQFMADALGDFVAEESLRLSPQPVHPPGDVWSRPASQMQKPKEGGPFDYIYQPKALRPANASMLVKKKPGLLK